MPGRLLSRRSLLRAVPASLLFLTACESPPLVLRPRQRLDVWAEATPNAAADDYLADTVAAWGRANGVDALLVRDRTDRAEERFRAAAASGRPPDALLVGGASFLRLRRGEHLRESSDLIGAIGRGGWLPAAERAAGPAGRQLGLPYGLSPHLLGARTDLVPIAGTAPQRSFSALVDALRAAQKPPASYGFGLALARSLRAETTFASLAAGFGAAHLSPDGSAPAVRGERTRAFVGELRRSWELGIHAPGARTWDAGSAVAALRAGRTLVVHESAPFLANASTATPTPSLASVEVLPTPGGLDGRSVDPVRLGDVFALPGGSPNAGRERTAALLHHLFSPAIQGRWSALALVPPSLTAALDGDAWRQHLTRPFADAARHGALFAPPPEVDDRLVWSTLVARVLFDGWPTERAIDEAEAAVRDALVGVPPSP